MKRIITITNQKGGVAKTTTASAMFDWLARNGYKVLAVDMDPQANFTSQYVQDVEPGEGIERALRYVDAGEYVTDPIKVSDKEAYLLPATLELAQVEHELTGLLAREYRLKEVLQDFDCDFVIVDTPPSLSNLTINALVAADYLIVPTEAATYAVDGLVSLFGTVEQIKRYNNPGLELLGVLITKFNKQTTVAKTYQKALRDLGEAQGFTVFETAIRKGVDVEKAQAMQESLYDFQKNSNVTQDYEAFVKEALAHMGRGCF